MWTVREIEFVRENYRSLGAKRIAIAIGRSPGAVDHKASQIGARSWKWTIEDVAYLRDHYHSDGAESCALALGRRVTAIKAKAWDIGARAAPRQTEPTPTSRAKAIIARVAVENGLASYDLLSSSRRRKICHARWQAMTELRHGPGYTLKRIGMCFGVDHTTVHNGLVRHAEIMAQQQREAAE